MCGVNENGRLNDGVIYIHVALINPKASISSINNTLRDLTKLGEIFLYFYFSKPNEGRKKTVLSSARLPFNLFLLI